MPYVTEAFFVEVSICVTKPIAQSIGAFVFAYTKSRFSHNVAH